MERHSGSIRRLGPRKTILEECEEKLDQIYNHRMTGDGSFFPDQPSISYRKSKSVLDYHPVLEFNGNKNDFWLLFDDSDILEKNKSRPLRKPQKPSGAHASSSKGVPLGAESKPGFSNTFTEATSKIGFLRPKDDDVLSQVSDKGSSKDMFTDSPDGKQARLNRLIRSAYSQEKRPKEPVREKRRSRSPERRRSRSKDRHRSRSRERRRSRSLERRRSRSRSPTRGRRYGDRSDRRDRQRPRSQEKRGRDRSRSRDRKDRERKRSSRSSSRKDGRSKRSASTSSNSSDGDSKGRSNKAVDAELLKKFAEKLQEKANKSSAHKSLSSVRLNSRLEDTKHRRAEAGTPIVFSLRKAPVKSFPSTTFPQKTEDTIANIELPKEPPPKQVSNIDITKPLPTNIQYAVPPPLIPVPTKLSQVPPPLITLPVSQQVQPLRVTDGVTVACAPTLYKGGKTARISAAALPPSPYPPPAVVSQPLPVVSQSPQVFSQPPPPISLPAPKVSQPMDVPVITEMHENLAAQALEYAAMVKVQESMPGQMVDMGLAQQNMGLPPPGFGPMMRAPPGPPPGLPRPGQGIRRGMMGPGHGPSWSQEPGPGMMGGMHFGPFMGPPPHGPEGPFMGPPPHGPEGPFMGPPPHGPEGPFMGPPPHGQEGPFMGPPPHGREGPFMGPPPHGQEGSFMGPPPHGQEGPFMGPPSHGQFRGPPGPSYFEPQGGTIRPQAPYSNNITVTVSLPHSINTKSVSQQPARNVTATSRVEVKTSPSSQQPTHSTAEKMKPSSSAIEEAKTISSIPDKKKTTSKPVLCSLNIRNFEKVKFVMGLIKFLQSKSDLKKLITALEKTPSDEFCVKNGVLCTVKKESEDHILVIVVPDDGNARRTIVTAFVLKYPDMDVDALIELFEQTFNNMPMEDIEDVFEDDSTMSSTLLKSTDSDFSKIEYISSCGTIVLEGSFKSSDEAIKEEKSKSASSSDKNMKDENIRAHSNEKLEKKATDTSKDSSKTSSAPKENRKASETSKEPVAFTTEITITSERSQSSNEIGTAKSLVSSEKSKRSSSKVDSPIVPATEIRETSEKSQARKESGTAESAVPSEKLKSSSGKVHSLTVPTTEIKETAEKSQAVKKSGTAEFAVPSEKLKSSSGKVNPFDVSKTSGLKADSTPQKEISASTENTKPDSALGSGAQEEKMMLEESEQVTKEKVATSPAVDDDLKKSNNKGKGKAKVLSKEAAVGEMIGASSEKITDVKESTKVSGTSVNADISLDKVKDCQEHPDESKVERMDIQESGDNISKCMDSVQEPKVSVEKMHSEMSTKDIAVESTPAEHNIEAQDSHSQLPKLSTASPKKPEEPSAKMEVLSNDDSIPDPPSDAPLQKVALPDTTEKKGDPQHPVETGDNKQADEKVAESKAELAKDVAVEENAEKPVVEQTAESSLSKELEAATEEEDHDSLPEVPTSNEKPSEDAQEKTQIAVESKDTEASMAQSPDLNQSKMSAVDLLSEKESTRNDLSAVPSPTSGHGVNPQDNQESTAVSSNEAANSNTFKIIRNKIETFAGSVDATQGIGITSSLLEEETTVAAKESVPMKEDIEPMEVDNDASSIAPLVVTEKAKSLTQHESCTAKDGGVDSTFEKKSEVEANVSEGAGAPCKAKETKSNEQDTPEDQAAHPVQRETTNFKKVGIEDRASVEKSVTEVETAARESGKADFVAKEQEEPIESNLFTKTSATEPANQGAGDGTIDSTSEKKSEVGAKASEGALVPCKVEETKWTEQDTPEDQSADPVLRVTTNVENVGIENPASVEKLVAEVEIAARGSGKADLGAEAHEEPKESDMVTETFTNEPPNQGAGDGTVDLISEKKSEFEDKASEGALVPCKVEETKSTEQDTPEDQSADPVLRLTTNVENVGIEDPASVEKSVAEVEIAARGSGKADFGAEAHEEPKESDMVTETFTNEPPNQGAGDGTVDQTSDKKSEVEAKVSGGAGAPCKAKETKSNEQDTPEDQSADPVLRITTNVKNVGIEDPASVEKSVAEVEIVAKESGNTDSVAEAQQDPKESDMATETFTTEPPNQGAGGVTKDATDHIKGKEPEVPIIIPDVIDGTRPQIVEKISLQSEQSKSLSEPDSIQETPATNGKQESHSNEDTILSEGNNIPPEERRAAELEVPQGPMYQDTEDSRQVSDETQDPTPSITLEHLGKVNEIAKEPKLASVSTPADTNQPEASTPDTRSYPEIIGKTSLHAEESKLPSGPESALDARRENSNEDTKPCESNASSDIPPEERRGAELEVTQGPTNKDTKDSQQVTDETQDSLPSRTPESVAKVSEIAEKSKSGSESTPAGTTQPKVSSPGTRSRDDVTPTVCETETQLEPMETSSEISVVKEDLQTEEDISNVVTKKEPSATDVTEQSTDANLVEAMDTVEMTDQSKSITEPDVQPSAPVTSDTTAYVKAATQGECGSGETADKSNYSIQTCNTEENNVVIKSEEVKNEVDVEIKKEPETESTPAQVKEEPKTSDIEVIESPNICAQNKPLKHTFSKFKSTYEMMKSMEFGEPNELYTEPHALNIVNYEKLSFLACRLKEIQKDSDIASVTTVMMLTPYDATDQFVIKSGLLCKRKDLQKNDVFIVLLKTSAVYREIVSALTEQYPDLDEFMSLMESFAYITSDEIKSLTETRSIQRDLKMKSIKYQSFIERCNIVNDDIICKTMLEQLRTMQKADSAISHCYNRLKVHDGVDNSYILKRDLVCQFVGTIDFKVCLPKSHPDQIAIMYIVHETNHEKDLVKFLEVLRTTFEGVNASLIDKPIALCSVCHPPATANATSIVKACEQKCLALKSLPPEVIFKMRQIQMASSVFKAQIDLLTKGQSRQVSRYILDTSLLCKAMTKGTEQVFRVVISPSGLKEVVSLLHTHFHRKSLSEFVSFVNEFLAVTEDVCKTAFQECYICNKGNSPRIVDTQKSPSSTVAIDAVRPSEKKRSDPSKKETKEPSQEEVKGSSKHSSKVSSGKDAKAKEQESTRKDSKQTPKSTKEAPKKEPFRDTSKPSTKVQVPSTSKESNKTEPEPSKTTWEVKEKASEPPRTAHGGRIRRGVTQDLRANERIWGRELGERIQYILRLVPDRVLIDVIGYQRLCPELMKTIKELERTRPLKDDKEMLCGGILFLLKSKNKPKIAVKPINHINYSLITKFHSEVHDWTVNKVHGTIGIVFDVSPCKEEVDATIDWFCHRCIKPETQKKKKIYSSLDEQLKDFYSTIDPLLIKGKAPKENEGKSKKTEDKIKTNDDGEIFKEIKKDLQKLDEIWGKELGEKIKAVSQPIPETLLKSVIVAQRECSVLTEIIEPLETSTPVKDARHVLCGGILYVVKSKKKAMLVKIYVKPIKNINYILITNLHAACHDWTVNRLQTTIGISFDVSPTREEVAVTVEWFCSQCQKPDTSSKKKKTTVSLEDQLKDLYDTIDPSLLPKDDDDDHEVIDLTQEVPLTDVRAALAKLPNPVVNKIQQAQVQSNVLNTQVKLLENTDGPAKGKGYCLVMSLLCKLVQLGENFAWRVMIPSEMLKDLVVELHTVHYHDMVQEDFIDYLREFMIVPEDMINEVFASCALCLTTVRRVPTLCERGINEDFLRKTLATIAEMIEFVIKWQTECPAIAKIRQGVQRGRQESIADHVLYKEILFKVCGKSKGGKGPRLKIAVSLLPNASDEVIKSTHAFYHSNNPNQLMNLINTNFDVTVPKDLLVTKIPELCNICRKKSDKIPKGGDSGAGGSGGNANASSPVERKTSDSVAVKKEPKKPHEEASLAIDPKNAPGIVVKEEVDLPIEIMTEEEDPTPLGVLLLGRLCDQVIEESSNSSRALDSPVPDMPSTSADTKPSCVIRQTCKIMLKRCKYDPKIVQKVNEGTTKKRKRETKKTPAKRGKPTKALKKIKEEPESSDENDSGSETTLPKRKFVVYSSESETDDSTSKKRKATTSSTGKAKKAKK